MRFEWGIAGALGIGEGADVIVWVDVVDVDVRGVATNTPVFDVLPDATVVAGSLRNRRAVADWVLAAQGDKGDRFVVAVVAAGEVRDDGSLRFALEDLLGSGAVIDALADLGIDYCSPEAAAASASFTGLRNATGHLIGSSGTGQQLRADGGAGVIERAIDLDSSHNVVVLREFRSAE